MAQLWTPAGYKCICFIINTSKLFLVGGEAELILVLWKLTTLAFHFSLEQHSTTVFLNDADFIA